MTTAEDREASVPTLGARLAIGFVQGLVAWVLIRNAEKGFGPAHPQVFAALVLATAFAPIIVIAGLGRMRLKTLLAWAAAAAAVVAGLAVYDLWREPLERTTARVWPSPQLVAFAAGGLYIAHHLIEPADRERTLFPTYRSRFEDAWRHGFQLALSLAFTAVFWAVLFLGASLFEMIGIKGFKEVIAKSWFACPVTAMAFAGAVHLTDVRAGMIRGVRTVGLSLLSWLLPLMAALTAAFLLALVFTGVQPLWGTRRATGLLLSAAAALIVLLNAAYQDGEAREALPRALRWAGRAAGLLLVPLVVLAAWAIALRIGQYGLTPERVASVAILVTAALYAGGYTWAAVSGGPWMQRLETVNVAAAVLILATILALFSPIADPARLSVADQVKRLERHKTAPGQFDFRFLRFDAARFGREALTRLARSSDPKLAAQVRLAQAATTRYESVAPQVGVPFAGAVILPAGATLPDSFRRQAFTLSEADNVACLVGSAKCDLHPIDINGDGKIEVLASEEAGFRVFSMQPSGRWAAIGAYVTTGCPTPATAVSGGAIRVVPPLFSDLEVAGQRLGFNQDRTCDTAGGVYSETTVSANLMRAEPAPKDRRPGGLGPAFAP